MGKNKNIYKNDTEDLQKEIKELKSINRHLERELKKYEQGKSPESKGSKKRDKIIQEDFDEIDKCTNCGKGRITKTPIGPRTIIGCSNNCGYRSVLKTI